jgi:uncharacterized membrane protein YheB (UPF0754 family)
MTTHSKSLILKLNLGMSKKLINIKTILQDCDQDMLYSVITNLLVKFPELEMEIKMLLSPESVSNSLAHYRKLVRSTIQTHNFSNFPQKGVNGLSKIITEIERFKATNLHSEAWKLASCLIEILLKINSNSKVFAEIEKVESKLIDTLNDSKFSSIVVEKAKTSWLKSFLKNSISERYYAYHLGVYWDDEDYNNQKIQTKLVRLCGFLVGHRDQMLLMSIVEQKLTEKISQDDRFNLEMLSKQIKNKLGLED